MAISMTGFGASQLQTKKFQISIQVKSVNGRFLETKFRLPRHYLSFENEMRTLVGEHLFRGSVEVFINRSEGDDDSAPQIIFKTNLAKSWLKASQKLAKDLKIKYTPKFEDILKIPDLYQVADATHTQENEKQVVLKVLKNALEDCVKLKKSEGDKLTEVLLKLISDVEGFLKDLDKKRPEIAMQLKSNLEKKLKDLADKTDLDQQRLHQESVYLLERSDIEEEVARLKSHLHGFRKALSEKGSVGKKLDFLVQEMHREINTMGAKTQALNAIESIINAKSFVEKIREQVQNIE